MAFVNTVDIVGDKALTASIIDGSITEYISDQITVVAYQALVYCTNMVRVCFPKVTIIKGNAFTHCFALQEADFTELTNIGSSAFSMCSALTRLIIRNTETVCSNSNSFSDYPIGKGIGYIYVPAALIEQYKTTSGWTSYAAQFRALEDYTVDGTTTGALDETKI